MLSFVYYNQTLKIILNDYWLILIIVIRSMESKSDQIKQTAVR